MPDTKFHWLRPWVYGCVANNCLVLLDARTDNYYVLSKDESRIVQDLLTAGFDYTAAHPLTEESSGPAIFQQLSEHGLVTVNAGAGKPFTMPKVAKPVNGFEHIEADEQPTISWHHYVAVFVVGMLTFLQLRLLSLRLTIGLVNAIRSSRAVNHAQAIHLAQVYIRLRPLLIKSRICLYDSLCFWYFCRIYSCQTLIVFGVTADPFLAHCWVQADGYILNDAPQNILQYTPIMTL